MRISDWSSDVCSSDLTAEPTPDGAVPLADIQRFVSVYRAVRQGYVDELSDKKVMQAALRGLLTDLDPHSAYLDKEQAQGMDEFANGRSEERRVGKECVSTCRSRWSPYN